MPCFVEYGIVSALVFSGFSGRYDGRNAFAVKAVQDPFVGIVAFVGNQRNSLHVWQEKICPFQITGVPASEMKRQRISQRITQGVDLGAQSTFGPADAFRFFEDPFAPAEC